jgi:hypothetical protein
VRGAELATWCGVIALAILLYVTFGTGDHPTAFGFNQWRHLLPPESVAWMALPLVGAAFLAGLLAAHPNTNRIADEAALALCAVASYAVFFGLQTHFLNPDGRMFAYRFRDIPATNGFFATHDELLELYVHSRFWYYTHKWWGWDVPRSYRPLSCGAGAMFIWLLLKFGRRLGRNESLVFVTGVLSGAYMQLFFGEVEDYTITAMLVMLYFLAADRFLKKEIRLWWPAMALAVGMCFHLLTGWMLPSLVYLFWVQWQRSHDTFDLKVSAALWAAIGITVLTYFHLHGLRVTYIISSFAGSAFRNVSVWVWSEKLPPDYYLQQVNLLFLLCPVALMALPLLIWRRFGDDEETMFLCIASAMLFLLQSIWRAQLGVYDDWNLFATGGLSMAVFLWRAIALNAASGPPRAAALTLAGIFALHTYAWIAWNHTLPM